MNTRTTMETVILRGDFALETILDRIDVYFAEGKLDAAERSALIAMAREQAKTETDPDDEIPRLWAAVRTLTQRVAALEAQHGQEQPGGETPQETAVWPAWAPPTGAHDAYYCGQRMAYTDGKRYTCIAPDGVAVTWGPDIMPAYWQMEEDYE